MWSVRLQVHSISGVWPVKNWRYSSSEDDRRTVEGIDKSMHS